jgi:hypothetical protein
MKSVSFIYDPISFTPFAFSLYEDGVVTKHGFYEPGKAWANQEIIEKPEWMLSTPFIEVDEKAESVLLSVKDDKFDDFEIKSMINKSLLKKDRLSERVKTKTLSDEYKKIPLPRRGGGISNLYNYAEFRALYFISDQKKKSPINQIRSEINNSKSIKNIKNIINNPEISQIIGNGQSRRLLSLINSFEKKQESPNRRAVRRADNLVGIELDDVSESSTRNRSLVSSVEKLRRF